MKNIQRTRAPKKVDGTARLINHGNIIFMMLVYSCSLSQQLLESRSPSISATCCRRDDRSSATLVMKRRRKQRLIMRILRGKPFSEKAVLFFVMLLIEVWIL